MKNSILQQKKVSSAILFILLMSIVGMTKAQNISFADNNVKALCVANWDTNSDGELSYDEAAAVTDLGTVFKSKGNIINFDELQYFTGLTSIGNNAFYYCKKLTTINIPNTVTSIGNYAFQSCTGLTTIVIPNSVTSIGLYAFSSCSGLTSLVIPNSVTSIQGGAFSYCSGLTSINIPNSVTSIEYSTFSGCSSLTSIDIPNTVTSIGQYAFSSCSGLTSIIIPNSVTNIRNSAFSNCNSLGQIVVDSGNTVYDSRNNCNAIIKTSTNELISGCKNTIIPNSVTSIGEFAFYYCSGLTSIDIPNSVTSIGDWTFSNCISLTTIDIPNSVTFIGYEAFSSCTGLTSIYIPSSVTYIEGSAFASCSALEQIVVELGNEVYDSRENCNAIIETNTNELILGCKNTVIPNSVTSIGYEAFSGCIGLTAIDIPDSVTFIGYEAFSGCIGLTAIEIPNSVTTIEGLAFNGCSGLTTLSIGSSVTSIGDWAFSSSSGLNSIIVHAETPPTLGSIVFENVNKSIPLYVPCASSEAYQNAEGWNAFTNCLGMCPGEITVIAHPAGYGTVNGSGYYDGGEICTVTAIPDEGYSFAYWTENDQLVSIEESYSFTVAGDRTLVANFTSAGFIDFADADVKALCVANWDINGDGELSYAEAALVTDLGSVFNFNGDISSFDELQYFTRLTSIESLAFFGCWGMNSIIIPNSVTSIGSNAFYNCSRLNSITIPSSVISIAPASFEGCSKLGQIIVKAGNPVYDSRNNCNAIIKTSTNELVVGCKNTVIPNTVTSIGNYAFSCCYSLTSIVIPNSVTSIGTEAFLMCYLTSITIPNSVTFIGSGAFSYCISLTSITVLAETPPSLGSYAFSHVNKSIPVYVPCASSEAYQNAALWNEFTNYFERCEYTITATANPTEGGTVTGAGTYIGGETCTLTVTANTGYAFDYWTKNDTVVSTETTYSFTVTGSATYVAHISEIQEVHFITAGNWSEASNWQGGALPGIHDEAFIDAPCQLDTNATLGALTISDGQSLTLQSGMTLNVKNTLTNTATSGLIIEDGAQLKHASENVSATVKKTIVGHGITGKGNYYLLSNPLTSIVNPELASIYHITRGNYDLYDWLATAPDSLEWRNYKTNDFMMSPDGYGYLYANQNGMELNFPGMLRSSDYRFGKSVSYDSSDTEHPGWNLIGNPFVCEAYLVNANNEQLPYYRMNAAGNGFEAVETGAIAPMEGVFYQASENGTVYFTRTDFSSQKPYAINVSANPTDGGTVRGGRTYDQGENCTLTATPNLGYTFANWTENGEVVSVEAVYSFVVTDNRTLVANFTLQSYTISVSVNPSNGGVVSGGGNYNYGQSCTVSATASTGYSFSNWTEDDAIVSTDATYTFIVNADMTLVANFDQDPYVDLGLPSGTLWAICNVGANSPEDYGDYFAWGETQPKNYYEWSTYQYCNGSYNTLTKYCNNSLFGYNGFTDDLTILEPMDDAATTNLGSDWRMPTSNEWAELYQNTSFVWTTQNGVNGQLFTASNGNSLFLPATGYRYGNNNNTSLGTWCYYWTSSLSADLYGNGPHGAWYYYYFMDEIYMDIYGVADAGRDCGMTVRPVRVEKVEPYLIIGATVNPAESGVVSGGGSFHAGAECTLTATANKGYAFTNWTENGVIVSVEATYSFVVTDNRTLVANFMSDGSANYGCVDLGLPSGLLWATCNVGAVNPEDYGDYFAWGETEPKEEYGWSTYQYCNGSESTLTKYCSDSNYGYNGFTDNLTTLLPEDDAATANWGSGWRMPSELEWQELIDNTISEWTTQNGVEGYLLTASNGNSLFLPAAGCRYENDLNGAGQSDGLCYWSGLLNIDNPSRAWAADLWANFSGRRFIGYSVRPVRPIQNNAPTGAINGKFTIDYMGNQVYFSQGNLQYQASSDTWRFADNQYDYVGSDNSNISSTYSGWIDLFGWGTSGYNHGAVCYQPWSTSTYSDDYCAYGNYQSNLYDGDGRADWGYNAISNGGSTTNQWRTLSIEEWYYLIYTRTTTSGICFAKANVNNVNGIILLPDDWSSSTYILDNTNDRLASFNSNIISLTQWNTLESAGAVFLPAAGSRSGTSAGGGSYGMYWSASALSDFARICTFTNNDFFIGFLDRYYGFSVRLVTPIEN